MDMQQFIYSSVEGLFQFLVIMDKGAISICAWDFVWTSVFIYLSKYLGMELLGHMVSVDLTLYKYAQLFSKVTVPFCDLPLTPAMPSLVSCVLAITW